MKKEQILFILELVLKIAARLLDEVEKKQDTTDLTRQELAELVRKIEIPSTDDLIEEGIKEAEKNEGGA